MRRRALLATLAAASSTAGCLRLVSGHQEPPTSPGKLRGFDPAEIDREVAIGERDGVEDPKHNLPHAVLIWNATSKTYPGSVAITDERAGETAFDESLSFRPDSAVRFELREPSTYHVAIRVPGLAAEQVLRVPREFFDCNRSSTNVGIFPDGSVRASVYSATLRLCADGLAVPGAGREPTATADR